MAGLPCGHPAVADRGPGVSALPEVDLDTRDPSFIADPYPRLLDIADLGPLVRDRRSGMVLVTRHAEVVRCLKDRRLGRVVEPVTTRQALGLPPRDQRWSAFCALERWSLLELEPPDHRRLRGLLAQAFTPRAVTDLAGPAETLAADLVRSVVSAEAPFDLLADVAQPYSLGVIGALLGIEDEHGPDLLRWSHQMVRMYELDVDDAEAVTADAAARDFRALVQTIVDDRRARPRSDLVSALTTAITEDGALTDDEIASLVVLLLNAGHEATVNTIGNGMATMLAQPAAWQAVTSGDVPAEVVVEEMLRHDPALQLFERWVLADDVEVAGHRLVFGDRIAMLFGAANRDPRAFDEPDAFRPDRGARHHVEFGGGIHVCIGAPLARLELATMVRVLAREPPGLRLTAPPRRTDAFVIRGYKSVTVQNAQG